NLAKNKRSIAYNRYQQATTLSGEGKYEELKKAGSDFLDVISLLNRYGVPKPTEHDLKSFKRIDFKMGIDEGDTTAGGKGFTKEQEQRLAEAFIQRIGIELGDLTEAESALKKQLARYEAARMISDRDAFGVSLLHHRSGHLESAGGDWESAADHFKQSAKLSLQIRNATGAATSIMNMTRAVSLIHENRSLQERLCREIQLLDAEILLLFSQPGFAPSKSIQAEYRNALGVYFAIQAQSFPPSDLLNSGLRGRYLQKGALHFAAGIRILEEGEMNSTRKEMAALSSLYLNLAVVSRLFGDDPNAQILYEKSLTASTNGLLPDLQWRALIGLRRFEDALNLLESITFLRAGCGKGEIIYGLGEKAFELIRRNQTEEAFNWIERISEAERYHRIAALINTLTESQQRLFREAAELIDRIDALKKEILSSQDPSRVFSERQLRIAEDRLQALVGKNGENLPEFIRSWNNRHLQETGILLAGTASAAESAAEAYVGKNASNARLAEYHRHILRYRELRDRFRFEGKEDPEYSLLSIFGPETVEAVDLMEILSENELFLRFFPLMPDASNSRPAMVVFSISQDQMALSLSESLSDGISGIQIPSGKSMILSYDFPDQLPIHEIRKMHPASIALNAAHFKRSVGNKKPFKRSVLTYPDPDAFRLDNAVMENGLFELEPDRFARGFHTLILSSPVFMSHRIPTRQGESASPSLFISLQNGKRTEIFELLGRLSQASLSILSKASLEDADLIGHLFSIFGCPSVILPAGLGNSESFIRLFLSRYPHLSIQEAFQQSRSEVNSDQGWFILGSPGITSSEAERFVQSRFKTYVEKGKTAFDRGFHSEALTDFENAILLARESKPFHLHLPVLYQYARESAHLSGNHIKALRHADALLGWLETNNPGTADHAEALLRLGFLQARLERFSDSAATLSRSLKMFETLKITPKQIEVFSGLGAVAEQTTDYERALTFFQSAVSLSKTVEKNELLARQYANMGRIYDLRLSNYPMALENYRKALVLYQEIRSGKSMKSEIAQSHLDIGRCLRLLGDFIQAEKSYEEALRQIGPEAENPQLYAKIVIEQANNAWFQARYQDAFTLQRIALRIAREKSLPLMEVVSLNTAGLLWWALGDHQKALAELKDALIRAEQSNIRKDEIASTLNNIGFIYREMGRYPDALQAFDHALLIDERLKSKWALAYDYRHKGVTLMKMGDFSQALSLLTRAYETAEAIGNRVNEARSQLDLGDCYLALGNSGEAFQAYTKALSLSRSMTLREVEWRALYGLARLQLIKNTEEARILLMQSIEAIEKIRSDIRLSRLKDTFLIDKLSVYETLCKLLADSGKPGEAFEIAERSRSRNFIDLLGNQRLSLNRAIDQDLYQRQLKLNARIEEIDTRRQQAQNASEKSGYDLLLASLNREMETLMLEIQSQNPQLGSLISVLPVNFNEFVDRIEPNVAFLDYYVLSDEILCWVIRSNGIRMFRIPAKRESLGERILEYRRRIQNLEPVEEISKLLFNQLVSPILSNLDGITTLGIIPHGTLHYLSFATLSDQDGYLIDRFSLFYLPSASVFKYTLEKRRVEKREKVLAIGNPDLGDPAFDLPFSEHEVYSIKWNFPEITILTHERATEKWVVDNIGKFGIIHLASHGEFDPVNPLFSSIKLARDEERDGNLEAAEIFGITINADLVVLSACQTGLSKVTEGDDIIGLSRAFLYAGTHTLISSLWRISDISTAILIKEFYRQFTRTVKAEGLRKAVLHVKNRYPHPGYWGGLTLVGDYR
ncbi:MAG: CHAT domain-containing tetratricopeptide repeat protein, partial [Thermodesulfobacteriota bacterium]